MAGYIGSVPVPQATETRDVYTATSNQTTFTTGGYTPNFVSVYLNGVHLARADYTATNGSDVVLAVGAAADDTVEIVSFATFEVSAQTFTGDVTASGGTFLPTGDTAAGDDAAVGYAAADGLVLTGQGSTSDVTIKNDADATVMSIPTGTTGATFAGDVIIPDGDLILGSTAVTSTAAELNILDGVTATAAEINLIDGGTARGTTAIADGDGVLINDAGTMRQTSVETLATYMGTKGLGSAYTRSSSAPNSPNAGDWWFNTTGDVLYVYDGTLGWLTNSNYTFGRGHYMVPGSFSVLFNGDLNRVPFEGASLGTVEAAYASEINGGHAQGSFGLSNSVRGVFSGLNSTSATTMEFVVMATDADGVDFGDLNAGRGGNPQSASHATRGVIAGGENGSGVMNQMDYITIASAGNATDFGNLSVARQDFPSQAMSSTVRSVFSGGYISATSNVLDYITVASAGNATDFGNLTAARNYGACVNSTTRGIHIAGSQSGTNNTMDYITIGTTGNATDFGDTTTATNTRTAYHSSTKAYIVNTREQITMATAGNATATGFTATADDQMDAVMPGWIAYNG